MPRGTRRPSTAFSEGLRSASSQLLLDWHQAKQFDHTLLIGGAREQALRDFLQKRLPSMYKIASGEIVDFKDRRSSQMDIIVYDGTKCSPLAEINNQSLLPAEGVLSVVEVKSTLSRNEILKGITGANSVRQLKPYKVQFSGANRDDSIGSIVSPRCFFTIFAYTSDLKTEDWAKNEWKRYKECCDELKVNYNIVDRLVVLDRGIINCPYSKANSSSASDAMVFQEWYINLINYLSRENQRRPAIDWQAYCARSTKGWASLS